MNILSFFTDRGIPAEELIPKIKIVDVMDSTAIVLWDIMTEISDGWYKYDFIKYNYQREYVVVVDGGSTLNDGERYSSTANDNSLHDVGKIVWDAQTSNHIVPGSFGVLLQDISNNLKKALGLMHENIFIDLPVYDTDNNLVSARVRIYSDAASVGTGNNVIGTYLISSTGEGPGKFTNWSQILI
jgi:hypothetical protein